MPFRYPTLKDRILANSKVNPAHEFDGVPCRDWTGRVMKKPGWPDAPREQLYGRISIRYKRGPRRGKVKAELAHRASVMASRPRLKVGSKNVVRHMCNRPICVEPEHLLGGRPRDNVRDCVKAGRHKTPFRGKRAKGKRTAARAT